MASSPGINPPGGDTRPGATPGAHSEGTPGGTWAKTVKGTSKAKLISDVKRVKTPNFVSRPISRPSLELTIHRGPRSTESIPPPGPLKQGLPRSLALSFPFKLSNNCWYRLPGFCRCYARRFCRPGLHSRTRRWGELAPRDILSAACQKSFPPRLVWPGYRPRNRGQKSIDQGHFGGSTCLTTSPTYVGQLILY